MMALRVRSFERTKRIQYLKEQLSFLSELPCTQSVTDRKMQFQNELENLEQCDREIIEELSDL